MHDITQAGRRLRSFTIVASVIAATLVFAVSTAFAQPTDTQKADTAAKSDEKPTARTHPMNPELWDVEQMMEEAVLQISRRYNLNKAQENYTRMLLKERVRSFLDEYEDDVRQLLAESIRLQTHPQDATIQDYMSWAERARPVYDAAQTAIFNGNDEWREILDDQQKKIHDQDIAQMERNFAQVSRVMQQWEDGKGVVVGTNTPSGTQGSTVGGKAPPITKLQNIEDNWMMYVDKFIQVYHFDEKQANSARAKIHKEYHDKAVAYRELRKKEFEAVNNALADPKFDKEHKDRPQKLLERRRKLEQPIYTLFLQMDQRLLGLADSKQLAAADEAGKAELEKWKATFSGQKSDEKVRGNRGVKHRPDPKPTTSAPASEPASTAPKKAEPTAPVEDRPAAKETPKPEAKPEKQPEAKPQQKAEQKAPPADQKAEKKEPAPKKAEAEKQPEEPAKS